MSGLRRYDAFVKTRPDMRTRSAVGGVITIVAATTAVLLLIGQLIMYIRGSPTHSLHLATSQSTPLRPLNLSPIQSKILDRIGGTINFQLRITFPHIRCSRLDVIHDGASLSSNELSKHHPGHSIQLRAPTSSELAKIAAQGGSYYKLSTLKPSQGCTVDGEMRIPLVAGSLVVSMNAMAWSEVTSMLTIRRLEGNDQSFKLAMAGFNVTHYIHYIRFGDSFPLANVKPLEDRYNLIENNFGGVALEQIEVKLVPTQFQDSWSSKIMYQMSVTDHQVQPATLVAHGVPHLPGVLVSYDFSPIAVRHHGGRDNLLVFLSSLVSIVGGVFVTVGMLTSCLVHSAKVVAKKVD
ncbi:hypothetical protein ACA910_018726 [Epithemia clementina (nom. ined.)]